MKTAETWNSHNNSFDLSHMKINHSKKFQMNTRLHIIIVIAPNYMNSDNVLNTLLLRMLALKFKQMVLNNAKQLLSHWFSGKLQLIPSATYKTLLTQFISLNDMGN